jgi:hypothetical protein
MSKIQFYPLIEYGAYTKPYGRLFLTKPS